MKKIDDIMNNDLMKISHYFFYFVHNFILFYRIQFHIISNIRFSYHYFNYIYFYDNIKKLAKKILTNLMTIFYNYN